MHRKWSYDFILNRYTYIVPARYGDLRVIVYYDKYWFFKILKNNQVKISKPFLSAEQAKKAAVKLLYNEVHKS